MVIRPIVCALVLLVLAVRPARADGLITPFIGFSFGGDAANCVSLTNCEEKRVNWGVSLVSVRGIFGFEEEIGYAPQFFGKTPGGDNGVLTVMSNVLVVFPSGPVRPYALFGVGFVRPHARLDSSSLEVDRNTIGTDIGGGVNLYVQPHLGFRGDIRHIHTLKDVSLGIFGTEQLDFWRASAGLTFRF